VTRVATDIRPRAAHLLLVPELAGSPPNQAIINALIELGHDVDVFAPDHDRMDLAEYAGRAVAHPFPGGWGYRGLVRSLLSPHWRKYKSFSATAEDPLAVAGCLAQLHRRPMIALVDEIKNGSYAGDRSRRWKALCRRAIRSSQICIVNDESRIPLVRDYAARPADQPVTVYPGCFRSPPPAADAGATRRAWGAQHGELVIGVSGGVNLTSGFDWIVEAAAQTAGTFVLVQPVNLDPFTEYLLRRAIGAMRGHVEVNRLSWRDAWASAGACDIGVAIYRNAAPQFQNMGVSSNRLCMYLAMGVPVIASRQASFQFIEDYGCGVLVSNASDTVAALAVIRENLSAMRLAARRAAAEHIRANERFESLQQAIGRLVQS